VADASAWLQQRAAILDQQYTTTNQHILQGQNEYVTFRKDGRCHDFHLAEDAAQEAFLEAHAYLSRLREPAAFPSWLRRIVFKHCDRFTRKRQFRLVPLEDDMRSDARNPAELLEAQMQVLLRHQEIRYRMILTAVMAIKAGDHPNLVAERLVSLYEPRDLVN